MIPKSFAPKRKDVIDILNAIINEEKILISNNVKFYIVTINGTILKTTLHYCCIEIDPDFLLDMQNRITKNIIEKTRFTKVIWE